MERACCTPTTLMAGPNPYTKRNVPLRGGPPILYAIDRNTPIQALPPPTFCAPMQAARPCFEPCAANPYATGICATRASLQNVLQSAPSAAIEAPKMAMRRKALRHEALRDAAARQTRVRFQGPSSMPAQRPSWIGVGPRKTDPPRLAHRSEAPGSKRRRSRLLSS
jgi:hypothetical protein